MSLTLNPTDVQHEAARMGAPQLASTLQEMLGQRMTAYLAGLNDARQVGRWIREEHRTPTLAQERMRAGFQVLTLIGDAYGNDTAQAWLFGSNTSLDDEAPATALREAKTLKELSVVVRLGRAFARGGY
jgi:hypothetical protein